MIQLSWIIGADSDNAWSMGSLQGRKHKFHRSYIYIETIIPIAVEDQITGVSSR